MRRAQPWRTNRARVLRDHSTSAEGRLWTKLRNRRLDGLKFVRQCPIGPFYADFVCRELKIIIEIDGATHGTDDEIARDRARTCFVSAEGYRVYRAHNGDIYENIDGVLDGMLAFIRGEVE